MNNNVFKDIRNLFRLKKEIQAIKDRITRDISNLFDKKKENYYAQFRIGNFLNMEIMEIYQLKNILIKSDHV